MYEVTIGAGAFEKFNNQNFNFALMLLYQGCVLAGLIYVIKAQFCLSVIGSTLGDLKGKSKFLPMAQIYK